MKHRGNDRVADLHYVRLFEDLWTDSVFSKCTAYEQLFVIRLCDSYRGGKDVGRLTAPYSLFNWSPATVNRARKGLITKGIIRVVAPGEFRKGGGLPTVYQLTPRYLALARLGKKKAKATSRIAPKPFTALPAPNSAPKRKSPTTPTVVKTPPITTPTVVKTPALATPTVAARAQNPRPAATPPIVFYTSSTPAALPSFISGPSKSPLKSLDRESPQKMTNNPERGKA